MRSLEDSKIDKNWKQFLAFRERRLQGIQTGIESIDKVLLGLGGVTVIQGETGTNKSTLALQIIHHNLKLGHVGIIIDKENGEGRLRSRLLCQANGISETEVNVCSVDDLKRYREPLLNYNLHIYTESTPSQEIVAERVREARAFYGDKPIILLADSLQAMTPVDPDQRVNLERWMNFFDVLKLEHQGLLTSIITSEKNRASYGQSGVGGGKGTSGIEYKAETLLDMSYNEGTGLHRVEVGKHRDGLKGARVFLKKKLAIKNNPTSFCFLLEQVEDETV